MKQLILALGILLTTPSFAAVTNYDLKMDLSINGKKVASPRMIVKEGEKGSVSSKGDSEENFIDVIATKGKGKSIMMDFKIGYVNKDGQRKIISEPKIIALQGEPAQIEISQGADKAHNLSLSVTANKVAK